MNSIIQRLDLHLVPKVIQHIWGILNTSILCISHVMFRNALSDAWTHIWGCLSSPVSKKIVDLFCDRERWINSQLKINEGSTHHHFTFQSSSSCTPTGKRVWHGEPAVVSSMSRRVEFPVYRVKGLSLFGDVRVTKLHPALPLSERLIQLWGYFTDIGAL